MDVRLCYIFNHLKWNDFKPKLGKPQGSVSHQEFEKMFIEQVYKKLEGKIKFKKNEVRQVFQSFGPVL